MSPFLSISINSLSCHVSICFKVEESIEKSTDAKEPEKEEAVEQAIEPMSA